MMKSIFGLLVGVLFLLVPVAQAGDLEAGRKKSGGCGACHGAVGISQNTAWPNLAGQQIEYLVKQMKAFREGARVDPWMSPLAKPLSDEDIEEIHRDSLISLNKGA